MKSDKERLDDLLCKWAFWKVEGVVPKINRRGMWEERVQTSPSGSRCLIDGTDLMNRVDAVIEGMNEKQRAVIMAEYLSHGEQAKKAEALGVGHQNYRTTLSRARKTISFSFSQ